MDNFLINMDKINISNKTKQSLKQVKETFKDLKIEGDTDDEIINYCLQLVIAISNVNLPEGDIKKYE